LNIKSPIKVIAIVLILITVGYLIGFKIDEAIKKDKNNKNTVKNQPIIKETMTNSDGTKWIIIKNGPDGTMNKSELTAYGLVQIAEEYDIINLTTFDDSIYFQVKKKTQPISK